MTRFLLLILFAAPLAVLPGQPPAAPGPGAPVGQGTPSPQEARPAVPPGPGLLTAAQAPAPAPAPVVVPVAAPVLYTPASAVELALADILTLDPVLAKVTRYISLYNVPLHDRPRVIQTVTFVVNSLSQNNLIVPPVVLADGLLLRINLDDYGIRAQAWDDLSAKGSGPGAFPEPYFHVLVEKTEPVFEDVLEDVYENQPYGRYDGYGRWYQTEVRRVKTGTRVVGKNLVSTKSVKKVAQAPWLDQVKLGVLIQQAQTQFPIVRSDWFIYYATLDPRYHELLGLGENLDDIRKFAAADDKAADKEGVQVRGAVLFSEVANHNRSLERTPTIRRWGRAYYWESRDYLTSVRNQDVLVDLLNDKPDAREIIFSLRNGLQGYAVVNAAGVRLDVAAADVAIDPRTVLHDKQVWNARNCMVCHAQGIIPIQDEVRLTATGPIALAVAELKKKDAGAAQRIVDRYFAVGIDQLVQADQAAYALAVKACNGLDPAANALQFQQALWEYYDRPITLQDLVLEYGFPEQVIRGVIERTPGLDHLFVSLLQTPPRRARRDQFEAVFGQLAVALLGVPVAPAVAVPAAKPIPVPVPDP
jgi:hypothetical protein